MRYHRSQWYWSQPGFQGSVLQWILILNLSVFIVQAVFNHWLDSTAIEDTFALSGKSIQRGFLWTPVTYAFLHAGLGHFLINSLLIYLFGQNLRGILGERDFLRLYAVSVLGGGLVYLLFHLFGSSFVLGASAGLAGLITVFCLCHYNQTLTFYLYFLFPISLKGKVILWALIGIDLFGLLFAEFPSSGMTTGIAHSSHLGGVLAGWLFFNYRLRGSVGPVSPKLGSLMQWLKRNKRQRTASTFRYRINLTDRKVLKKEADRVLDKINSHGFASLTDEERHILDRMQETMQR